MNRNTLKYIAVIAMLADHIALAFVGMNNPAGVIMRVIGRLTAPIMCYFLAEGFFHTRITGPGKVYLQSMPINNLADTLIPFLPQPENHNDGGGFTIRF